MIQRNDIAKSIEAARSTNHLSSSVTAIISKIGASLTLAVSLLLLADILGCAPGNRERFSEPMRNVIVSVDRLPDVGEPLDMSRIDTLLDSIQLLSLSSFVPGLEVLIDGIQYLVVLSDDGRVVKVCTFDPQVETPEGIRVGADIRQSALRLDVPITYDFGSMYYISLPSGWTAGVALSSFSGDTLPNDAAVSVLLKR